MCDCYSHKCEMCDTMVPMHIGDFKFPREAFHVWCNAHVDVAPAGAVVFTLLEYEDDVQDGEPGYPMGLRFAIFGPEVGDGGPGKDNYPNIGVEMSSEVKEEK